MRFFALLAIRALGLQANPHLFLNRDADGGDLRVARGEESRELERERLDRLRGAGAGDGVDRVLHRVGRHDAGVVALGDSSG